MFKYINHTNNRHNYLRDTYNFYDITLFNQLGHSTNIHIYHKIFMHNILYHSINVLTEKT